MENQNPKKTEPKVEFEDENRNQNPKSNNGQSESQRRLSRYQSLEERNSTDWSSARNSDRKSVNSDRKSWNSDRKSVIPNSNESKARKRKSAYQKPADRLSQDKRNSPRLSQDQYNPQHNYQDQRNSKRNSQDQRNSQRLSQDQHNSQRLSQDQRNSERLSEDQRNSERLSEDQHSSDLLSLRISQLEMSFPVNPESIFDRRLEDHLDNYAPRKLSLVIEMCCCAIFEKGVTTEGLLRIPGTHDEVEELRRAFDKGEKFDLLRFDVHAIGSALKLYLREMPEPLIPYTLYDAFIKTTQVTDLQKKLDNIKALVYLLPPLYLLNLRYLIMFLNEIAKHELRNKMNFRALGVCMGANLLRTTLGSAEDSFIHIAHLGSRNHICELLISKASFFFPNYEMTPQSLLMSASSIHRSMSTVTPSKLEALQNFFQKKFYSFIGNVETTSRFRTFQSRPESPTSTKNQKRNAKTNKDIKPIKTASSPIGNTSRIIVPDREPNSKSDMALHTIANENRRRSQKVTQPTSVVEISSKGKRVSVEYYSRLSTMVSVDEGSAIPSSSSAENIVTSSLSSVLDFHLSFLGADVGSHLSAGGRRSLKRNASRNSDRYSSRNSSKNTNLPNLKTNLPESDRDRDNHSNKNSARNAVVILDASELSDAE